VGQGEADLWLELDGAQPLARWLYVVAAPFNTIRDGVTLAEVKRPGKRVRPYLVVEAETAVWLRQKWGEGRPQTAPTLIEMPSGRPPPPGPFSPSTT
jgi:hypothetical protein